MFRRLVLGLCAVLAMGALASAQARYYEYYHRHQHHHDYDGDRDRDELIVISEQDVDLSLDKFTIDVRQAKGAYKGIRVRNAQGRLFDLQRVQVVYSDGSVWNEDRQIDMYRGERSRPINQTTESRFIDQVNITQVPGPGRGRLQVIGIQDDDGRRMDRSGRGPSPDVSNRPDGAVSGDLPVKPTVPEATQTTPGQATAGETCCLVRNTSAS
jgi:hypothetical protein